ncbi:hypothetical protein E05_38460 [Plautia stali symbiont]|nr:hypothetical protein E05_38460 [Plautia stali symbiont]
MVAGQHNQLAAAGLQRHHETVKQFARVAGWRTGIKQVAGDDQRIHLMLQNRGQQPVEELLVLGGAAFAVKELTEMPVSGVNYAHECSVPAIAKRQYNRLTTQ